MQMAPTGLAVAGSGLLHNGTDLVQQHAKPVVHLAAVAPGVQRVGCVLHRVCQQRERLPARTSTTETSQEELTKEECDIHHTAA